MRILIHVRAIEVQVREATPKDDAFLRSLGKTSFSRWSNEPGESVLRLSRAPGAAALIADREGGSPLPPNGAPVGFAIVRAHPLGRAFGPWQRPGTAHLDGIAVARSARGAGVGSTLLAHAEDVARARGAVVLSLVTAVSNVRARKLFEGRGYLPVARFEDYYLGQWDAIAMFRWLGT